MLKKQNRVGKKTIEQIFKKGLFISGTNLSLKFIHLPGVNTAISFIVPKAVAKGAVVRNLLRRRGYAVLKKYWDTLPQGLCGVFVFNKKSIILFAGRKNKNNNPILNLKNEIKNILSKIN